MQDTQRTLIKVTLEDLTMDTKITLRDWIQRFNNNEFEILDVKVQIDAGWYDWFCRDTSLKNKTKKMVPVHIDIFAYGYDSYLARQSISDEIPLYNLIHADDIINIDKNLIYVNENHKKYIRSFK